ncbi:MAG: T9SS type A sorting domain-containing protein, partial [Chitinophagaceae bacterium]
QLGNGNTTDTKTPAQLGADNNWVCVAGGSAYSIALKSDGTFWSWGANGAGELGDGTNDTKITPVLVRTSNGDWLQVANGESHTTAIKDDGTLWAWGKNTNGQLGDGTTIERHTPTQIGTDNKWVSVSCGGAYTIALKSNGTLWSWGLNDAGQLGDGTFINKITPVQVGTDSKWVSIAAAYSHTIGLKCDGTLWSWGSNVGGRAGLDIDKINYPLQVGTDNKWVSIAVGSDNTFALKSNGSFWGCGDNTYGQLGYATEYYTNRLTQLDFTPDCISISAGAEHTAAIKSDGSLWVLGNNNLGQLGLGADKRIRYDPTRLGTDNDWISIQNGNYFTNALKSDGTLWAWGTNYLGQLGDGTKSDKNVPILITTENYVVYIAAASTAYHSAIIKSNRTKICLTGSNNYGELGDGTNINRLNYYCIDAGSILPLRLLSFSATKTSAQVNRLDWNTSTETPHSVFTITRSDNGNSFYDLGKVPGKGANSGYTYYDEQPLSGINYYRLKITEPDGGSIYSNVAIVRNSVGGTVTLAPQPALNNLTIRTSDVSFMGKFATIYDMQGKKMLIFKLDAINTIDVSGWAAGIYSVHLPSGQSLKIIKQ